MAKKGVKPKKRIVKSKPVLKPKRKPIKKLSKPKRNIAIKQQNMQTEEKKGIFDTYSFESNNIPINISIKKDPADLVPIYSVEISAISETTKAVLEKIRQELIKAVNLGMVDIRDFRKSGIIEEKFTLTINKLIRKYFPSLPDTEHKFLAAYLTQRALGLGNIEILKNDVYLEEIVVNSAKEPVWVYHKFHGWLKTNITIGSDEQIKHFASTIGRKVGRQVSVLTPLMDANLEDGDRVNSTLFPISTKGHTLTIRKFSREPWTMTHFIESKTINPSAAALIWLGIQYELSAIIAGGTASGKTSTLNAVSNFFPPNQRIISIEDTRELRLPKFLHWVPMSTRMPNSEGKGAVSMEDLLVNSLRMRPDRILVGEVRRKREAETLFEAIHTGHSCYATFHANNAFEVINRLTNPPIDVPKTMMPAISMLIVQFRNRRTGVRRTFQIAEVLPDSSVNILHQYNPKQDLLEKKEKSKSLFAHLEMFTGSTPKEIGKEIEEKANVLKYLVKNKIKNVDAVGRIIAEYYINKNGLLKAVSQNKAIFPNEKIHNVKI